MGGVRLLPSCDAHASEALCGLSGFAPAAGCVSMVILGSRFGPSWHQDAIADLQGSTMFQKPTVADLREAAERLGMRPSEAYLDAVAEIITPLANAYATLDATPDELPPVKYPQREFSRPPPAEN